MSNNLQQCLKHFELVSLIKNPKKRRGVLAELAIKECYFSALREMVINAIKGNVKLNKKQRQQLNKHRRIIGEINCKKKRCKKSREKLLIQSGGFLQFLIPAVIETLIGSLKE